jgi:hypothetical protein
MNEMGVGMTPPPRMRPRGGTVVSADQPMSPDSSEHADYEHQVKQWQARRVRSKAVRAATLNPGQLLHRRARIHSASTP